jgi:cytochrome c-type biogenesis protein CcsB
MIIVIVGMGLASLNPNKEIEPLVPALQSYWLHLHVFFASISYGFFLASAVFALFYIIKVQQIRPTINAIFDGFSVFCLTVATASSTLLLSPLQFNKVEYVEGKMYHSKEIIQLPTIHYLVIFLCLLFLVTVFFQIKDARAKKEMPSEISKKLSMASFAVYFGLLVWLVFALKTTEGLSLASNPYKLGLIVLGFFTAFVHRILFIKYQRFIQVLPSAEMLDQLSYKSILVSIPLLTLVIVTGSVWAHYTWGRYWGWDPKETWSFITWLIYCLYLHLRLQKGWQGVKISFISLIGFMAVIFTYLGVNILLSGLHAYN